MTYEKICFGGGTGGGKAPVMHKGGGSAANSENGKVSAKKDLTTEGERDIMDKGIKIGLQFFAEKDIEKQDTVSLKRAMRKFEKRIAEHKDKIQNPEKYVPNWNTYSDEKKQGLKKHWLKEIRNFEESIQNRIDELKKRGEYDE